MLCLSVIVKGITRARTTIPLCNMTLFYFSIRIHFGQITSNQMLVPVIEKLKETTISKVSQVRVSIFVKRQEEAANPGVCVGLRSSVVFWAPSLVILTRSTSVFEKILVGAEIGKNKKRP